MTLATVPLDPPTAIICSICDSDKREIIDPLLATGKSAYAIEKTMKKAGIPVKEETVRRHLALCLKGKRPSLEVLTGTLINGRKDFAASVVDAAQEALDRGELRVRAADGLTAQGLIDRRIEKQADRDLMVNLAKLMTGAPPPEIIVGEYTVLDADSGAAD